MKTFSLISAAAIAIALSAAFLASTIGSARLPVGDWPAITRAVREATGRKGRELYQPLRAALTHALEGPELGPLLALMPSAVPRLRLEQARELCSLAPAA